MFLASSHARDLDFALAQLGEPDIIFCRLFTLLSHNKFPISNNLDAKMPAS